jgi:putative PIN family toxin of toxin-antitoxin system
MRTAKTISITLPPDLLVKAQELATREHRTMSELFREALRRNSALMFGGLPGSLLDLAFLRVTQIVEPEEALSVIVEDPDDNRVLECAVKGQADVIVSRDRHLLRLANCQGISIVTVRHFLKSAEATQMNEFVSFSSLF